MSIEPKLTSLPSEEVLPETRPCPLCPIIARQARGHIVRETKRTSTIVALEGQLLLLPKKHLTPTEMEAHPEIGREIGREQFTILARLVKSGAQGINMQLNCGELAGQKVAHAHIHFFERTLGDNLGWFPVGLRHKKRSVRNRLAEGYRQILND